jgi:hypothetical protein
VKLLLLASLLAFLVEISTTGSKSVDFLCVELLFVEFLSVEFLSMEFARTVPVGVATGLDTFIGRAAGATVEFVGAAVGATVEFVGAAVGTPVGAAVGTAVTFGEGADVGAAVGAAVGAFQIAPPKLIDPSYTSLFCGCKFIALKPQSVVLCC